MLIACRYKVAAFSLEVKEIRTMTEFKGRAIFMHLIKN